MYNSFHRHIKACARVRGQSSKQTIKRIMSHATKLEQRSVIRFLMQQGQSCSNIHTSMVDTCGTDAPSLSTVKKWVWEFKHGKTSLEDDPRSGRPTSAVDDAHVNAVQSLVKENRSISTRSIALELDISATSVRRILHEELKMSKVAKVWVPHFLTTENMENRVSISTQLLARYNRAPLKFKNNLVTEDETMLTLYDPETASESKVWKFPGENPPISVRKMKSCYKVMLIIFWDQDGILLKHFVPSGETVNAIYYANLLEKLRQKIKDKRRGMLGRGVMLLQDNARPHTAATATATASKCGYEILPHPAYSPDLAPSDYYLFSNLKKDKRGIKFGDLDAVRNWTKNWLKNKDKTFFSRGIEMLPQRWERCIELKGRYLT